MGERNHNGSSRPLFFEPPQGSPEGEQPLRREGGQAGSHGLVGFLDSLIALVLKHAQGSGNIWCRDTHTIEKLGGL